MVSSALFIIIRTVLQLVYHRMYRMLSGIRSATQPLSLPMVTCTAVQQVISFSGEFPSSSKSNNSKILKFIISAVVFPYLLVFGIVSIYFINEQYYLYACITVISQWSLNDIEYFDSDNLEWLAKSTNWAKFTATASLGVVHKGHESDALSLMSQYLPKDSSGGWLASWNVCTSPCMTGIMISDWLVWL